ncbi:uncharacterized protein akna isoform X2 [Corythoichthys intestinalis]|uniref:uncharacterized protein akna isoform X2 n=1 Tax=Corythoichthys intestinalis TaxID=161448 RepID=UPI0025A5CB44|nr:uncharacterized protein akna isoform X2 [Corythoichthys intestinalis]
METVKNTKAGVLSWTLAPVCSSSDRSEDEWDGGEEQDNDFSNQMDDNGIIGLTQEHDNNTECIQASSHGPNTSQDLGGHEVQHMLPEESFYPLRKHLEDADGLSAFGDDICTFKERSHHEDKANELKKSKEGLKTEYFSERDTFFGMAQGKRDGAQGEQGFRNEPVNNNKEESEIISEQHFFHSPPMVVEADGDCKPQCPTYQVSSHPNLPIFTPLCHFTSDAMAAAPGIAGETVPDMGLTESPPDSNSLSSGGSSPQHQQNSETEQLEEDAVSPHPLMSKQQSHVNHEFSQSGLKQPPTYSLVQRSQPCNDAVASHIPKKDCPIPSKSNQSRKGNPNHRIPDLSNVKSRISLPKVDYKPPKSRWSTKNPPKSLAPEAPVVFKSPADIVKEVLLNTTDGPQSPFAFQKNTLNGGPNGTVPQEFRSQQKAGILLDQLQEDHGRLLTKYAEAANTIDRLRLEAKVNLYSEQPKPPHVMPLEVQVEPSKFMQLDFPQAQKVQPSAVSPQPSGQSTHKRVPSGLCLSASISKSAEWQGSQKVANSLYAQADKFLQKLQHFEDSLKSKTPFHQVKGFTQLCQGLESLEKGYLCAKKEHKVLQQQGAKHSKFDPNRELEEFIYQCGRHMDELKEVVDQSTRDADSAHSLCLQARKTSPSDDSHSETQHTSLLLRPVEVPDKEVETVNLSSADFKKRYPEQAMDVHQGSAVRHTTHSRRKDVRKSYSSSQSSLAEISTPVKRSAKPQTGIGRLLSQDGVISPGTDSGFVGSEYSHQVWTAAPCSFHQGASKGAMRPAQGSSGEPQTSRSSSRSRGSSQSHRSTPMQPGEYFQQTIRRLCPVERKQRQWVSQTDTTRTDSESINTMSEDIQSDQYEETPPCSSPNSSPSTVRHRHGDSPQASRSSQVVTCNDPSRLLQSIKSTRPKEESLLNNPNSSQVNCNHHRTLHPLSRKKWTIVGDEAEQVVRRTARKRLTHRQQAQPDTSSATEDEHFARRLLVSRSTQTSIAVADGQTSHASAHVQHIKKNHAECATDNVDSPSSVPPCSQCLSNRNSSCERTASGNQEQAHFSSCHCHHCHHCGHSDTKTSNEQDCCRDSSSPRISTCQPALSPSKVPPQPAVCPTPLLLYLQPQPVHMCSNNTSSPPDLINTKKEERAQHLPCIVPQRSLDDALLAARKMKDRSERMVRSLNSGLRSLDRLSKSRSNSNSD